jgi:predicted DNA-binding transcriptional regulator AlpA
MSASQSVDTVPARRRPSGPRTAGPALAARRLALIAPLPREARVMLSIHELSLLLGLTPKTIRRRIHAGHLPPPDCHLSDAARSPRWWRATVLATLDRLCAKAAEERTS